MCKYNNLEDTGIIYVLDERLKDFLEESIGINTNKGATNQSTDVGELIEMAKSLQFQIEKFDYDFLNSTFNMKKRIKLSNFIQHAISKDKYTSYEYIYAVIVKDAVTAMKSQEKQLAKFQKSNKYMDIDVWSTLWEMMMKDREPLTKCYEMLPDDIREIVPHYVFRDKVKAVDKQIIAIIKDRLNAAKCAIETRINDRVYYLNSLEKKKEVEKK